VINNKMERIRKEAVVVYMEWPVVALVEEIKANQEMRKDVFCIRRYSNRTPQ
jgi:RIO-like serine/threonine protein kinase